ncbi:MAG: S53 family peptidase [Actinoallomurus sp.]
MRRRATKIALGGSILALLPFLSAPAGAAPQTSADHPVHRACAASTPGMASCDAIVRGDIARSEASLRSAKATPSGLTPADIQSLYHLPSSTAGSGQTVAIVDAYDDPNAESDLNVYRGQFGLGACTTANGCFKKVNQTGGTALPPADAGWAEEESLDLDMVSAVCPKCKVVLVEGTSASFSDLGTAENTGAKLANVISNSYGGSGSDAVSGTYYNHPGRAITASGGDDSFGVPEYPASSHYVTAVGGTSLQSVGGRTVEVGLGRGACSSNQILAAQVGLGTGCGGRATNDVAAIADPNSGVAVYDTYGGVGGWLVFGGTSVGAPIIAGVYGLAANAASIDNNYPYAHPSALNDITSGGSGGCTPPVLCTAGPGWDGPTGMGTPNGVGAF